MPRNRRRKGELVSIIRPKPSPALRKLERDGRRSRGLITEAILGIAVLGLIEVGLNLGSKSKIRIGAHSESGTVAAHAALPRALGARTIGVPAPALRGAGSPPPRSGMAAPAPSAIADEGTPETYAAKLAELSAALPRISDARRATPSERHLGNPKATFRLAIGMLDFVHFVQRNPEHAGAALNVLQSCAASSEITPTGRALCAAKAAALPGIGPDEERVLASSLDAASLRLLSQFSH